MRLSGWFLLAGLVLAGGGGIFLQLPDAPVHNEDRVPNVPLLLLEGETRMLHSYGGRPVMLHFWATWCTPCVAEFPRLLQWAKAHPEWTVLLVSADEKREAIQPFLHQMEKKSGIILQEVPHVEVVWDQGKVISQETFHSVSYPETIIISPDLTMQDKIVGAIDFNALVR
jgi:thiol-disulfide isomerase/thioredoxin